MPGMLYLGPGHRQLQAVHAGEGLVVEADNLAAALLEPLELPELPQAECGLDVRHVVLEAGLQDVVAPAAALVVAPPSVAAHPVQAHDPPARQEVPGAGEHSPLTGREVLRRVEAESRQIRASTDGGALVLG